MKILLYLNKVVLFAFVFSLFSLVSVPSAFAQPGCQTIGHTLNGCCFCTFQPAGYCECEYVNCITCYLLGYTCPVSGGCGGTGLTTQNSSTPSKLVDSTNFLSLNLETLQGIAKINPRMAAIVGDLSVILSPRGKFLKRGRISFAPVELKPQDIDDWILPESERLKSVSYQNIVTTGRSLRIKGDADAVFLYELEPTEDSSKATLSIHVVDPGQGDPPMGKLVLNLRRQENSVKTETSASNVWEIVNWVTR